MKPYSTRPSHPARFLQLLVTAFFVMLFASQREASAAPTPLSQPLVTGVNTETRIQVLHGNQNPGDTHTYAIVNPPLNGTAAISPTGILSYLPGLNYSGKDSVIVEAMDQSALSGTFTVKINVFTEWTKISAGNQYSLALKADGTLWGWGANWYGQLGIGSPDYNPHPVPTQIGSATDWATIFAGVYSSAAIKKDRTLWTWGLNDNGQLGDGSRVNRLVPVQVGTDTDWTAVSVGEHMVALKSDGSLWAWGDNGYGQLGDGTLVGSTLPIRIGNDTGWRNVAAGNWHTVAVKTDGTLWAWGLNYFGALGDGTNESRNAPTQIGPGNNWLEAAAGTRHSVAIKMDGSIWSWGDNDSSQLGDDVRPGKTVPGRVGTDSDWVMLRGFGYGNLAMKNNGSIWEWGNGIQYPLGPVQTGSDADWAALSKGAGGHSLALKNDGTLWSWGWNAYGELGNTTAYFRSTPDKIVTPDTTRPLVTITSPQNGVIHSNNPLLTYAASEGTVVVRLDGVLIGKVAGERLAALAEGAHMVRVEATDAGGNVGFFEVNFTVEPYTVTLNAGPNGSIAGPDSIYDGDNATYSITPSAGYQVADVLVDGVSVGAVTSYSFTNVTADHSISASFAPMADLIVTGVTGPNNATRGKSISVSSSIMNREGTNAGTFTVSFYLSKDTAVTGSDTLLGTKTVTSLNVGSTTTVSGSFTVPSAMATGKYYVAVIVDSGSTVPEANESNNSRAADRTLIVK